jgi:DNA-binding transcriptional ArsR family regulator
MAEYSPSTLDSVFHALSDATRRGILRDVAEGAKTVSEIAEPYTMSLAAVSKHLQVLERAELIRREKKGNFRMARLNADTLRVVDDWLQDYEIFWSESLQSLKQHVEEGQ